MEPVGEIPQVSCRVCGHRGMPLEFLRAGLQWQCLESYLCIAPSNGLARIDAELSLEMVRHGDT